MKPFLAVLTVCLALLAAGTLALLAWQYHVNQRQTAANTELSRQLQESQEAITRLTGEKADVAGKLTALEAMEKDLRARVDSLETAAKAAEQSTPRPYRVRAFLGQDNVGLAWIVPHNIARDPDSGRYTFEPVLVIDESSRDHFTVHHTNVVEREVYTTEIYEGYTQYPYYYYLGNRRPGGTNRPSLPPGRPSYRPRRPLDTVVQQPDARARVFAPPMSVVNTRPQVMGTPGTSPINQRVFAP